MIISVKEQNLSSFGSLNIEVDAKYFLVYGEFARLGNIILSHTFVDETALSCNGFRMPAGILWNRSTSLCEPSYDVVKELLIKFLDSLTLRYIDYSSGER